MDGVHGLVYGRPQHFFMFKLSISYGVMGVISHCVYHTRICSTFGSLAFLLRILRRSKKAQLMIPTRFILLYNGHTYYSIYSLCGCFLAILSALRAWDMLVPTASFVPS